jgi:hypothetical protein
MKKNLTFATVLLAIVVTFVSAAGAATPQENLVAGVFNLNTSTNWAGFSAVNLISGASLLPATTKQTVLYIAFTGGSIADISNMVLYSTTARSGFTVGTVTSVKLGGASNPSINLTNTKTCPNQPVSASSPCIVKLDAISLVLSPLVDYYFVAYFANDTNNQTVSAGVPASRTTTLTGLADGQDDTQLKVGQTLPTSNNGHPYFLVAAMNE